MKVDYTRDDHFRVEIADASIGADLLVRIAYACGFFVRWLGRSLAMRLFRFAVCWLAVLAAAQASLAAGGDPQFFHVGLQLLGTPPGAERPEYLARPTICTFANNPFGMDVTSKLPPDPLFVGPHVENGIKFEGILRPNANGQLQLQATLRRGYEVENDAGVTIVHHDTVDVRMTLKGAEVDPKLTAKGLPKPRTVKLSDRRLLVIHVYPMLPDQEQANSDRLLQAQAVPSAGPPPREPSDKQKR